MSQDNQTQLEIDREKGNFFYDTDYAYDAGTGLTSKTIDYISGVKGEDPWILEFRQKALKVFESKTMPTHWAPKDLDVIDFEKIRYYLAKGQKTEPHLGRSPRRCEAHF